MADAGLPWSIPNAGFSIQPVNGEFAAWSKGSSVPPDGWSVLSGSWPASLSRCQGGTGPWAVDFGSAGVPSTLVSDYIVVLPNTRYLLSALYRIVSGTGAALSQGVRVDWYDDARALISSTNLDLVAGTSGSWTYLGVDTTSPIQAVYAKVVAGRFNVNGSADLQIDAIKLDRAVYIPSGVISLDDVTDGVTYARPRGAYMSGGIINAVVRGAGTVATDFLFKKPNIADPDTLDGVPDSATYGKVKNTMLTAGEVTSLSRGGNTYATSTFFQTALDNLDVVLDGSSFRKVGTAYVDASNRITGVLRGTSPVAGADLFAKTIDTLDNVSNGTTYARVNATALSSGNPKTDSLVDGTYSKVLSTHITSGAITSLTRGGTLYATSTFFQKALDNLDNVLDGSSFRKVGTAYVDSSNRVTGVLRGTSPVAGADLFAKTLDTLDNVSNGTTYARVNATALSSGNPKTDSLVDGTYAKVLADHLTSGAITSITRGGTRYASTSFFNTGLDNLSNIANGGGFNKTSSTYVNTSGQITSVRRLSTDESVDNLFKKSSDTFASVAGTLSDGQLGSNVVNASNVKAQAIDWSKLDDGTPIMAWDEGRGSLLAGRVTYTNGGTLQVPEANQGYTSWNVTSGTTDFYVETDVQFRTIKDQFVSITYRTGGTTGWAASSTMRVFNMANVTQQATATMYGDGLWHTAVFDISAFTGTSTIRFDPQDGGAAIGAGATFWVSNVAVGNIGVGPGGGHSLVSYRGAVGINKAVPGVDLDINGGNSQNVWARLNGFGGIPLFATQRAAGTAAAPTIVTDGTEIGRLDFRGYDGSAYRQTAYISSYVNGTPGASDMPGRLVFATTSDGAASATERMQITRDGVVAVNKPTAGGGAAIYINGTDTVYQSITTTSGTVASFPQLQIINYNANGGFPVTAHYNSKGTAASPAALSAGDTLGSVIFYGRGSSTSYAGAEIKAFTSIAPATNISGLLTFSTASAAVSATERMRIDKDGRVSLGGSGNAAVDGSNSYLRTTGDIQVNQSSGIISNAYYAGGWKFAANGRATSLNFETGDFIFYSLGNNVAGGPGAAATATQRFRVYETGGVQVNNLSGTGNRAVYSDASGILTNTSSDGTLKEDVQSLENVLPVVMKMNPVSFSWKDQERFGPYTEVGFLAQEMLELVPFVVGKNADDTFTIDYPKLTAVLARAIQELKQQVDELASSLS